MIHYPSLYILSLTRKSYIYIYIYIYIFHMHQHINMCISSICILCVCIYTYIVNKDEFPLLSFSTDVKLLHTKQDCRQKFSWKATVLNWDAIETIKIMRSRYWIIQRKLQIIHAPSLQSPPDLQVIWKMRLSDKIFSLLTNNRFL